MSSTVLVDLSRKCGDDVSAAILRTIALVDNDADRLCIALSGAAIAMANLKGIIQGVHDLTEDEASKATVDILGEMLAPGGMEKLIADAKTRADKFNPAADTGNWPGYIR